MSPAHRALHYEATKCDSVCFGLPAAVVSAICPVVKESQVRPLDYGSPVILPPFLPLRPVYLVYCRFVHSVVIPLICQPIRFTEPLSIPSFSSLDSVFVIEKLVLGTENKPTSSDVQNALEIQQERWKRLEYNYTHTSRVATLSIIRRV